METVTETKKKKIAKRVHWTEEEWETVLEAAAKLLVEASHPLSLNEAMCHASFLSLPSGRARYSINVSQELQSSLDARVTRLHRLAKLTAEQKATYDGFENPFEASRWLSTLFVTGTAEFKPAEPVSKTAVEPAPPAPKPHFVAQVAEAAPSANLQDDDELFLTALMHPRRLDLFNQLAVDVLVSGEERVRTLGGDVDWQITLNLAKMLKEDLITENDIHAMLMWLVNRRALRVTKQAVMVVGLREFQQQKVVGAFADKAGVHRVVLFKSIPNSGVTDEPCPVPSEHIKQVILFAGAPSTWINGFLGNTTIPYGVTHVRKVEEVIEKVREMLRLDNRNVQYSNDLIDKLLR